MIKHSQAITIWDNIWNAHTPFPFKATIRSGLERVRVTASLVRLNLYFKHLEQDVDKKPIIRSRTDVGASWLSLYPFIPNQNKIINRNYKKLVEYFLQQPNYTPIDIKTLRPLWESYE